VGSQFLDNTENSDLSLDAYFVNDLRLGYQFSPKGTKGIELSVMVNNIFDTEYASNGYSYDGVPYVFPQAGANFLVMANFKF
jgi:iron complex outermembrane receptor protein